MCAGGGGSTVSGLRGELRLVLAARVARDDARCGGGGDWLHTAARVAYRPFGEPAPPLVPLDSAALKRRPARLARCAYATLLYDDSRGYAHGAFALYSAEKKNLYARVLLFGV